jgi:hypothetical protein
MTRKDYVAIAAAVKAARPTRQPDGTRRLGQNDRDDALVTSTLDAVVLNLTEALTEDNPRFDAGRFIDACGGA